MSVHKLGPTGRFPDGKVSVDDNGELNVAVTVLPDGTIKIDFGCHLSWIGFDAAGVRHFVDVLLRAADKASKVKPS